MQVGCLVSCSQSSISADAVRAAVDYGHVLAADQRAEWRTQHPLQVGRLKDDAAQRVLQFIDINAIEHCATETPSSGFGVKRSAYPRGPVRCPLDARLPTGQPQPSRWLNLRSHIYTGNR